MNRSGASAVRSSIRRAELTPCLLFFRPAPSNTNIGTGLAFGGQVNSVLLMRRLAIAAIAMREIYRSHAALAEASPMHRERSSCHVVDL